MTVYFYTLDENGKYKETDFSALDSDTKRLFYGFAKSEVGNKFLQNFVNGKQSFSLDKDNSITINGNGNDYDTQYAFGDSELEIDQKTSESSVVHGSTKWSLNMGKPTMTLETDITDQKYEDQIMTFGHENIVHAQKDIDNINRNYPKGSGLTESNIIQFNSTGYQDHVNFNNQNSLEFKQMKAYLYYMKGWLGGTSSTTDKKLEQAFEKEYLNNKRNVSGN